jgi:hypothetical protein
VAEQNKKTKTPTPHTNSCCTRGRSERETFVQSEGIQFCKLRVGWRAENFNSHSFGFTRGENFKLAEAINNEILRAVKFIKYEINIFHSSGCKTRNEE